MKSQLPAFDPAFWNITSNSSNSKPGDFESDMIKMLYSTGIDLQKENEVLKNRINHLETALRRIANTDYRGNRSTESQIAFEALKDPQ